MRQLKLEDFFDPSVGPPLQVMKSRHVPDHYSIMMGPEMIVVNHDQLIKFADDLKQLAEGGES